MGKVVIFCEGNADSIDKKILTQLLPPEGQKRVHIPLGGKYGSPAFIRGYMTRGGVRGGAAGGVESEFAVCLRDRDFDFEILLPFDPKPLERPDRKNGADNIYIYATHRAAMENYLLSSDLLAKFLEKDTSKIAQIVVESARNITHYSAIRQALGQLRKPFGFETTWMEGSGHLPAPEVLAAEESCFEKGWSLVSNFQAESYAITRDALRERFEHFQRLFSTSSFWEAHHYLTYFHGKDLAKSIGRTLINERSQGLENWKDYYSFAIKQTNFEAFADLQQFKSIVQNLGNS